MKKNPPSYKIRESGCFTVIAEIHHRCCILETVLSPDNAGLANAFFVRV
jgi:hypothetical protein